MNRNVVLAVTGASGAIYAVRLLEVLLCAGCHVHLTISAAARDVLQRELQLTINLDQFDPAALTLDVGPPSKDRKLQEIRALAGRCSDSVEGDWGAGSDLARIHYVHYRELTGSISSGSFQTSGMVVCPCSCGTLGAIVHGASANLIHRAAEVHLKQGRRLILVPRETPLSLIQLKNMRRAAEAGAVVLPAMPGFYHGVESVRDLVDFVVARVCDQLDVPNALIKRWGS